VELIPHKGLIYDCDQDWSQLPERWESELAYNADVVFAASAGLVEHLSPCNTNVALVPNGVVYPMFAPSGPQELPFPGDLISIQNPILGYAGTIWEDLDLGPVVTAAKAHPEWNFLFVGRVRANPNVPVLRTMPNVHFLGQKPISRLPEYVTRFDVCLTFVRLDRSDYDVLPPRFYEYLATGRPVVSMGVTGQDEEYPDVTYTAYTPVHFVQKCEEALKERSAWNVVRRQDYAAAAAWSRRAEQVQSILVGNAII
jgi:glycosyltransferase involved in cell wall biosynthesis